jgi:pimeloyl-ACP methyl ester carboxylesterase
MYYKYIDNKKDKDILLIHSFPSFSIIFEKHISILSFKFNILLIDIPGFGSSINEPFISIDNTSDQIIEIIKSLKIDNLSVWGISFGGVIGINIANKIKLQRLILEAVPLNSDFISTSEFKALNFIEKNLIKVNSLDRFSSLLRTSKIFRMLLLIGYKIVNFGKNVYRIIPLDVFMTNLDVKSLFKVSRILQDFDTVNEFNNLNCKIIGIYDSTDPVINYEKSIEILNSKSANILNYTYKEHCSSLVLNNCVADDVVALIG